MTQEALTFQHTPVITFGYIVQLIFSLVVVLTLIYLIAKYLMPRLKLNPNGKLIQVLDRAFLEPQVSAYLLKVGKNVWLVAASQKRITKIDKLEESELV
ncbi:FliO/MopB family protein [Candidatus Saganbacteria bacterium]|nr:FliO/MopB family protein [Candidatus Saganbacteria bacterium]